MANSSQAKKRIKQAEKRRQFNVSHKSKARTSIKKITAMLQANDSVGAREALKAAIPVLDAMVNKGLYGTNKVARLKRRISLKVKKVT